MCNIFSSYSKLRNKTAIILLKLCLLSRKTWSIDNKSVSFNSFRASSIQCLHFLNLRKKEKSFVGTATELCSKLNEMYHESFAANSLGKKLNCYRIVMKKYGINYDNTRIHDKRQISLTLNLPSKESKEPDGLEEKVSLSSKETVPRLDGSRCISRDEFEFKEGQVYRERLDMYVEDKDAYTVENIKKAAHLHAERAKRAQHKSRTMEDENFQEETFSFRMQDKL